MVKTQNQKIIVILGQTATGKSDLAVALAKKLKGEIISADSRQVYKGLDIGTGKITTKEMKGIPHYFLSTISPKKIYSVAQFQKEADKKIKEIFKKGKIPIICGGTGFYIDSLINKTPFPAVPPNKKFRKNLEKMTTEELFRLLKKSDPRRAKNIDGKNKVRLIRALEIIETLGKVPSLKNDTNSAMAENVSPYKFIKIGLTLPPEILKERIKIRLLKRLKAGMLKEVEKLNKNGLNFKRMEDLGLEYRYLSRFLQKKITREQMIEELNKAIWRYAKRQNTYFKRDKEIIYFNPLQKNTLNKIEKITKKFLKEKTA